MIAVPFDRAPNAARSYAVRSSLEAEDLKAAANAWLRLVRFKRHEEDASLDQTLRRRAIYDLHGQTRIGSFFILVIMHDARKYQ